MATLHQVLSALASELDPDSTGIQTAKDRATSLADSLHRSNAAIFRVVKCIDHGSVSRGTCIRDFDDLDVLVELNPDALQTTHGNRRSPGDTIGRMAQELKSQRGGLIALGVVRVRAQEHSVGVIYGLNNKLRVDLVPAIRQPSGRLLIPERGSREWIPTDPTATKNRLENALQRAPDALAAIRLLKGWRRARGRNAPIPSFGIETMIVNAVHKGTQDLVDLMRDFFQEIGEKDARKRIGLCGADPGDVPVTLIDPVSQANLTLEIDHKQRSTLIKTCRRAQKDFAILNSLCQQGSQKAMPAARSLFLRKL